MHSDTQIEGDIAKQLRECPRSVIVIDDVQSMDWHLVDHLAKTVTKFAATQKSEQQNWL